MGKDTTIRALAESLPKTIKTDKSGNIITITRKVRGIQLIKSGTTHVRSEDGGKEKVIPNRMYQAPQPLYLDHHKELKMILRKMGWEGVETYCRMIRGLEQTEATKKEVVKQSKSKAPVNPQQIKNIKPTRKQRWREFFKRLKMELKKIFS